MFTTLLIANRGEIACRIIRTARRLGIRTVAIHSDADAAALHVRQADAAVRVGPAPAAQSYLDIDAVLAAARQSGAEAIHPGYGFLSENAAFAEACERAGIVFVGPPAAAIRAMGSKIEAKRLVAEAGAPVVPGYPGDDQSDETLIAQARRIGFPLLIKASAGGGGKGMRRVDAATDFAAALAAARREAQNAFGDDRMLLERYLTAPKHLEVQILADATGNVLHLFERDCSVQRRHQKVIEEAPGPSVHDELRAALGAAAVRAARAVAYRGAGTVEFIYDTAAAGDADALPFYFMEMNTRLQVEHPVTEAVTGLDLVEWQLRIAAGEALPMAQHDLGCRGHAIEARVYAENPRRQFLPSTGRLVTVSFPDHVRVDTGVAAGDEVSVHYDPMLAKVISHGRDRAEALARLDQALAATAIAGVEHNLGFLRAVLATPAFRSGDYTTRLLDDAGDDLLPARDRTGWVCAALALQQHARRAGAWGAADGFRLNQPSELRLELERDGERASVALTADTAQVDDQTMRLADIRWTLATPRRSTPRRSDLQIATAGPPRASDLQIGNAASTPSTELHFRLDDALVHAKVALHDDSVFVMRGGDTERFRLPRLDVAALAHGGGGAEHITSPMPGQVIAVAVQPGEQVRAGQVLLIIEAMKMEHSLTAPRDGRIAAISCAVGDRIDDGVELVTLEAAEVHDGGES